ncbi:Tetratricopeptide repeat protein [Minicystis rosea]|nr:Tetratricopeptide repeat protein [Minicystis rosea]
MALVTACHAAILGGPPGAALAQGGKSGKSVTTTLVQRGSALFDDQQYEESIQTLSAALVRPGASDKEKIETYRLLAYNFIILKRTEEADAAARGIFVIEEGFSLPPSESPRFREFFANAKKKWVEEGKPGKVVVGASPAAEKPIKMTHTSPPQVPASTQLKLTGAIDDPDGRVRGVQLAYRTGVKGKFVTVAASYTLGEFRATIPGLAVKPPLVEYYITGVDKGGLPLASRGDAATPLRVVVPNENRVLTSPALWVPVGVAVVGGAVATAILLTRSKGTSTVTVGVRE